MHACCVSWDERAWIQVQLQLQIEQVKGRVEISPLFGFFNEDEEQRRAGTWRVSGNRKLPSCLG